MESIREHGLSSSKIGSNENEKFVDKISQNELTLRIQPIAIYFHYLTRLIIVFTSRQSLCDKFWRPYLSENVKDKFGLFVFDECYCIRVWGDAIRPLYKDVSYLRATAPKIPIMLLSATLPPHLENQICHYEGVQSRYETISFPLNRANIFYFICKIAS